MDETEQFIKMADCPEIQEQWKKEQYGDILAVYDRKRTYENGSHYYTLLIAGGPPIRKSKNRIWLPRQDDIQKMMKGVPAGFIKVLYNYIYGGIDGIDIAHYFLNFETMEQLWLAFYMHEKHSKVWSSKEEKWVKK